MNQYLEMNHSGYNNVFIIFSRTIGIQQSVVLIFISTQLHRYQLQAICIDRDYKFILHNDVKYSLSINSWNEKVHLLVHTSMRENSG